LVRIAYLNGEFLPEEQARISILDRGFLYGDGLFETMRAYSGRVFRLAQHYERLASSAERIGLRVPLPEHDLSHVIAELLRRSGLLDAYVRLTISRGEGLGMEPPDARPTVSVVARELVLPDERLYREGASVIVTGASAGPHLAALKSLSYLGSLLARRAARQAGADDAVLTNAAGHLTEASSSNLFFVKNATLCTPSLECGLLPGITRHAIVEIAGQVSLPAQEGQFTPEDLRTAEEAFLTNSIAEVLPVTRVDGAPIGSGKVGPVTAKLMDAYRRLVASELSLASQ